MSVLAFAALALIAAPTPRGEASPPPGGPEIEVRYIDDSTMKLRLLDEKLELVTKHGVLQIAVADVRRVEFATRIPSADADKIAAALAGLRSGEFKTRERAVASLLGFRARAYAAVLKAAGDSDPEVATRAKAVAADIRRKVPEDHLRARETDVVYTDDSKITGKLTAAALRVETFQFGEQRLRLADVRSLGPQALLDPFANAPVGPPTLIGYANQFGKELTFKVFGGPPAMGQGAVQFGGNGGPIMLGQFGQLGQPGGPAGGHVWGNDTYTLDSSLWAAAVHAGVIQPGQTGVVHVKLMQSPAQFGGSTRNGITSQPFGFFPGGAFEFVTK